MAVSEGDLPYVKIVDWYGPLPLLVQGAGFRTFGVGLDTMVWMNIALTVVVLLLIHAIFGTLGNRMTGWLATVVFVCVFAFGHYSLVAITISSRRMFRRPPMGLRGFSC